jgi:hypothetical protein
MPSIVNEESHLRHTCLAGGGNASIRPYQCHPHWQAAGVPTGCYDLRSPHYSGYKFIDHHVTTVINHAFGQIDKLLATARFDTLAFSYNSDTKLGGNIFKTDQSVRDNIYERLVDVSLRHRVSLLKSIFEGHDKEGDFDYMIVRQPKTLFVFNDNEEQFYEHFNDLANPYRL